MAKKSYLTLLKDPRWQKKRLEVLTRDQWTCQLCQEGSQTLHVHHKHYYKDRLPWEYADHELVTLCVACHTAMEPMEDARKQLFARLALDGPHSVWQALALVAGWADQSCGHDLGAFRKLSPHSFRVGEVSSLLDLFPNNLLDELVLAASGVGSKTREEAMSHMVGRLRAAMD